MKYVMDFGWDKLLLGNQEVLGSFPIPALCVPIILHTYTHEDYWSFSCLIPIEPFYYQRKAEIIEAKTIA